MTNKIIINMTEVEFENNRFGVNDLIIFEGIKFQITEIDFHEGTFTFYDKRGQRIIAHYTECEIVKGN